MIISKILYLDSNLEHISMSSYSFRIDMEYSRVDIETWDGPREVVTSYWNCASFIVLYCPKGNGYAYLKVFPYA